MEAAMSSTTNIPPFPDLNDAAAVADYITNPNVPQMAKELAIRRAERLDIERHEREMAAIRGDWLDKATSMYVFFSESNPKRFFSSAAVTLFGQSFWERPSGSCSSHQKTTKTSRSPFGHWSKTNHCIKNSSSPSVQHSATSRMPDISTCSFNSPSSFTSACASSEMELVELRRSSTDIQTLRQRQLPQRQKTDQTK